MCALRTIEDRDSLKFKSEQTPSPGKIRNRKKLPAKTPLKLQKLLSTKNKVGTVNEKETKKTDGKENPMDSNRYLHLTDPCDAFSLLELRKTCKEVRVLRESMKDDTNLLRSVGFHCHFDLVLIFSLFLSFCAHRFVRFHDK